MSDLLPSKDPFDPNANVRRRLLLMVAGGLVLGAAPARVRRPLLACSAAALFVAAASMADYQLLP